MATHTRTQIVWMLHACHLARERLEKLPAYEMAEKLAVLDREVKVRQFVMDRLHIAEQLHGSALVWYRYMLKHADAQIERYSWQISERTFHQHCQQLREKRDAEDIVVQGQPWTMEPELIA